MHQRFQNALVFALVTATLLTLVEWAGWRGKFAIWGDPVPLSTVWWHWPGYAAFFFLLMMLWPWSGIDR
jgi:hypothetical protein